MSERAAARWAAAPDALGHRVSRGIVLSAGPDDFALVLHPAELVWPLFAEPRSLDEVVAALTADGAPASEARAFASRLVDDLVDRRLLRAAPSAS